MNDLFTLPSGIETRWASPENPRGECGAAGRENGGRKGRPNLPLHAGESVTLAEEPSGVAGTVRRIWLTISDRSPAMLRGLRLDCFWDGAERPAVSAPLGDFFSVGLGRAVPFESAFFSSPEGRSFNSVLPMPFRSGMRLVLTNESGTDLPMLFYDVDYTVGDAHGPDMLYLHAHWRRERPTTLQTDYELLPQVTGRGRFLGVNVGVIADTERYARTWWGEGEVKIYLDGDTDLPTLCGTGTEDYIGTGWGQGAYSHRYQGCPVADHERMAYCFYRYHVPDPVYFRQSTRVAIQQIGHCFGEGQRALAEKGNTVYRAGPGLVPADLSPEKTPGLLFERQDDWSSCAYFYLDRSQNDLPALPPVAERIAGLTGA
jgi:hypothetical protein